MGRLAKGKKVIKVGSKTAKNPRQAKPKTIVVKKTATKKFPASSALKSIDYSNFGYDERKYQKHFKGIKLEKYLFGQEVKNKEGSFYLITNTEQIDFPVVNKESAKNKLYAELTLIDGIARLKEKELKTFGYNKIEDLLSHHKFQFKAKELLSFIDNHDGHSIHKWVRRRNDYPKYNTTGFSVSSFFNPEDFIVIDLETLGFNSPAFLIGIGYMRDGKFNVDQLLARDLDEEGAIFSHLKDYLKGKNALLTYNGASFDVPLIKSRANSLGIDLLIDHAHFDMYYFCKRAFDGVCYDYKLKTLESEILGHHRRGDVPGFLVPSFYSAYMSTGNIGTVIPIIDHNKQDIITTFKLFEYLHLKEVSF